MSSLVLAVNPVIAAGGQIAAIVICFYILIFVIIAVAFNLAMSLGIGWLREKVELIKLLRPTVNSINKTTEAAVDGRPTTSNDNTIIRAVAQGPAAVHTADKKVDELTDRVVKATIEFRARTVQVQTVAKAFIKPFLPKPTVYERELLSANKESVDQQGLEFNSPGYRQLMERQAPEVPVAPPVPAPAQQDGRGQAISASQLRDVNRR